MDLRESVQRTAGTSTFPIPAAPPPPPPPPPVAPLSPPSKDASTESALPSVNGAGRGALLNSIKTFKKGGLKRAVTSDHSAPRIS